MGKDAENDTQPHSVKELASDYGNTTTMHGLGRVFSSNQRWRRVIWALLVITSASWAIYQLSMVIIEFRTYPVSTTVSEEYTTYAVFPAVTICNLNKIRFSELDRNLAQILRRLEEKNYPDGFRRALFDYHLLSRYQNTTHEMGHHMEDMLIDCTFDSKPCSAANFTRLEIPNTQYGNCFRFPNEIMLTTTPGPDNGLILELDIEQNEYIQLTRTAGIKVVIHPFYEWPFPEQRGLTVAPGLETNIGIRRTDISRQSPPYGSCVDADESTLLNIFAHFKYSYTDNACRVTCYQSWVYRRCQCCDVNYPCVAEALFKLTGQFYRDKNGFIPFCGVDGGDGYDCLLDVERRYFKNVFRCTEQCPPACNQTSYSTTISTGHWPALNYHDRFIQKLNDSEKFKSENVSELTSEIVASNFLRLKVYYESMVFEKLDTTPAYNWQKLLGDIGGQLGLWLGFSVLTAVELIELLFNITVFMGQKLFPSRTLVTPIHGKSPK